MTLVHAMTSGPERARRRSFHPAILHLRFALCVFVIGGAIAPVARAAATKTIPQVYKQERFLMQALLQTVAGDFFGDGRTGLALSGRNYEAQEAFVHVLYWDGSDFTSVWQSEN